MKKTARSIVCLLLSAMSAFSLFACNDKEKNNNTTKTWDTEKRPIVFATEALDGKFSPFFATSGTDSEMASMTQIGMLTTDENGNTTCGEDEPTVALAYDIKEANDQSSTEYKFIIKNDIKFSDGTPLTIKDVLFNLYVYLDPAYTGSATMYSTDIVGLAAYRQQNPDIAPDSDESAFTQGFYAKAQERIQNMLNYLDDKKVDGLTQAQKEKAQADIVTLKDMFKEEVNTDWTAYSGTLESYKDEYDFTEDWQVFYLAEQVIRVWTVQGKPQRDENGKYITNITPSGVTLEDGSTYNGSYYDKNITEQITAAMNDPEKLKEYTDKNASLEDAKTFVARDFATQKVYEANTLPTMLPNIIKYWATGADLREKFVAEARTEYFDNIIAGNSGKLKVETISGIKTEKTTTDFKGNALGAEHDVLKITINGIDPKAIYNFSFAVAPLHYYSGTYEEVDYIAEADGITKFGVKYNDSGFFEEVLQAPSKMAKPVGAGAYQASNERGETGATVSGADFYSNNWVYFARNEYFHTVGEGLSNAKIKFLQYKVTNSDKLIEALRAKNIDVGEPNATAENITTLGEPEYAHLASKPVPVNGYGYVGINPKYVPDVAVRRAIMMAMDPIYCLQYYTEANAEIIYRPMSSQSWIWQYIEKPETYYYALNPQGDKITALVEGAGWEKNTAGKYEKNGETLKYTFTIAGATEDHPAAEMFEKAATRLNSLGFDITVATDIGALKKLATGQLEVWAAAWSSTVDPDMYQIYSLESTASSTNNWGKTEILADTKKYAFEYGILLQLKDKIDDARKINDQASRSIIYGEALDLVMQLAVELPTYQRNDCVAYNKEVINAASLNQNPTAFAGIFDRIWEVDYN